MVDAVVVVSKTAVPKGPAAAREFFVVLYFVAVPDFGFVGDVFDSPR